MVWVAASESECCWKVIPHYNTQLLCHHLYRLFPEISHTCDTGGRMLACGAEAVRQCCTGWHPNCPTPRRVLRCLLVPRGYTVPCPSKPRQASWYPDFLDFAIHDVLSYWQCLIVPCTALSCFFVLCRALPCNAVPLVTRGAVTPLIPLRRVTIHSFSRRYSDIMFIGAYPGSPIFSRSCSLSFLVFCTSIRSSSPINLSYIQTHFCEISLWRG